MKSLLLSLAVLLTTGPQLALGHSWLEQANRIASNGTIVLPNGYPMGWGGRQAPDFSDTLYTNRMPESGMQVCRLSPLGQQKDGFPALTAAPGDFVALRYLENGHVTKLEEGRAKNSGIVYVYGTTDPRPDEVLTDIHKKWTADGTGGDGRGRLLATRHYDDGQCYEANGEQRSQSRQSEFPKPADNFMGPHLWCQTDIQIPSDLPQGSEYVLYWVWSWPLLKPEAIEGSGSGWEGELPIGANIPGGEYLESEDIQTAEMYSSCITINIDGEPLADDTEARGSESLLGWINSHFTQSNGDFTNSAIKEQLLDQFLVDVPGDGDAPGNSQPAPEPSSGNGEPPAPVPTEGPVDGIRTVTVTAEPTTVYATATVTAGASNGPGDVTSPIPEATQPAGPPTSIEPFMARRNLRGRSSWGFGTN